MPKKCFTPLALFICAAALLTPVQAQERPDGILFLHFRLGPDGATLLRSSSAPGRLKANPAPENFRGLEFEVAAADGTLIRSGAAADPLLERLEFPDPDDPASLRSELLRRDSAEFVIRLPGNLSGEHLRLFRRRAAQNDFQAAAERELLGEFVVPAPEPRLRAFATDAQLYTLRTNGPTAARLNIAILAEGFTTAQRSSFTNRAQNLLNQFLDVSPYKEYRNHFNAFAIFVPSAQSGSDHPEQDLSRNTYFNSSYGTGALARLITIPPNEFNSNYSEGRGKVFALLEEFVPDYDIALLLVNDSEYGGSGGVPAIASIHSSAVELALHEVSHSFAGLGDEYDAPYPGYPDVEEPNTTRETRRDRIKWRDWIETTTPIPTPEVGTYANVIGLFEGAHFHPTGWYRPKLDCRMQTLGQPFCEVCKEAIVLSAYSALGVIQDSSPAENNITVPGGGELLLSVRTTDPAEAPLVYAWTVDGVTNSAYGSNTFPASFDTLGFGTRLVRVSVHDPTPLVRTDPTAKLWKTRSWLVQVPGASNQPPVISPIADVQWPAVDSTVAVSFTVTDPDTPIDKLVVAVRSSNTNLLSEADMELTGSGTNRTLVITTHCGLFGASSITLEASDGDNSVSTSFSFTANGVEEHLMIEPIPDQVAFAGTISVPVYIIYDGCTVSNLSLFAESDSQELLPDGNLVVSGSGTNWTLQMTPVPERSGTARVSVSVSGGLTVARQSFSVTFTEHPVAIAETPVRTEAGLLLRFNAEPASSMILESSSDLEFWTPIRTTSPTNSLEHLVPGIEIGTRNFYRLRLVPF